MSESVTFLSRSQKRIVAGALTVVAALLLLVCSVLCVWVMREFISLFSSVLWPLAAAGILAMLLRPVVLFLQKYCRLKRQSSIVCLYVIAAVATLGVMALVLPMLVQQLIELVQFLPEFVKQVYTHVAARFPGVIDYMQGYLAQDPLQALQEKGVLVWDWLRATGLPLLKRAGDNMVSFFSWITGAAIVPVYLYYMLESRRDLNKDIDEQLLFLKKPHRDDLIFLLNEFASILTAFFRGQILIAVIMGVLLAGGFSMVGLKFGLLLGMWVGLMNVVPYLGTITGLGIVLPLAYFQVDGGLTMLGLCLLVFIVVQVIEGYLLTPKIMGGQTGLHPMAIIVAIFFWGIALNGLLGMILAIPLTAFFVVAWRMIKMKYLPQYASMHSSKA